MRIRMRRDSGMDSANKNAEFSQLVSAMGCLQERRLFINISLSTKLTSVFLLLRRCSIITVPSA